MKSIEVKASTKNKESGEKEEFIGTFDLPETVSEAVEMFGEEDVYSCWKQQQIIRWQASLRPSSGKGSKLDQFKKAAYEKLIAAGMDEDMARDISEYSGPAN